MKRASTVPGNQMLRLASSLRLNNTPVYSGSSIRYLKPLHLAIPKLFLFHWMSGRGVNIAARADFRAYGPHVPPEPFRGRSTDMGLLGCRM